MTGDGHDVGCLHRWQAVSVGAGVEHWGSLLMSAGSAWRIHRWRFCRGGRQSKCGVCDSSQLASLWRAFPVAWGQQPCKSFGGLVGLARIAGVQSYNARCARLPVACSPPVCGRTAKDGHKELASLARYACVLRKIFIIIIIILSCAIITGNNIHTQLLIISHEVKYPISLPKLSAWLPCGSIECQPQQSC